MMRVIVASYAETMIMIKKIEGKMRKREMRKNEKYKRTDKTKEGTKEREHTTVSIATTTSSLIAVIESNVCYMLEREK